MTPFTTPRLLIAGISRGSLLRVFRVRDTRPLLLGALLLCLSGCVWLRLLEVKGQVSEFDQNFDVEITDRLALRFRHPVMYAEDFRYLTELDPTRIEPSPPGMRWTVDFHKLDTHGKVELPKKTLSFWMDFNAEQKLSGFAFSPLFLAMAPAEFLEASIRSLGKGSVDTGHRQLRVDPRDLPTIHARLPTRSVIHGIFGRPFSKAKDADGTRYVYRFLADVRPLTTKAAAKRLAEVHLLFQGADESLAQMQGRFVGLKLRIDYRKLQGSQKVARD